MSINFVNVVYLEISFVLLQHYSEKLYHLKRDGLNKLLVETQLNTEKLDKELTEMIAIANDLSYKPDMDAWNNPLSPLYPTVIKSGVGVITPIYKNPLTKDEYLREKSAKDCWQLTKAPHYYFDKFCQETIYPILRGELQIQNKKQFTENLLLFQIRWWKFYIASYLKLDKNYDVATDIAWMKSYLTNIKIKAKFIDEMLNMLEQMD